MTDQNQLIQNLASLTLFADLSRPQLEAATHIFEEQWFAEGQRILRKGFTGAGFYIILEGEAIVRFDSEERRLRRGDFFGEISILLDDLPVADVIAAGPLLCLELPGPLLSEFLLNHPPVMLRMLQTMAYRVARR